MTKYKIINILKHISNGKYENIGYLHLSLPLNIYSIWATMTAVCPATYKQKQGNDINKIFIKIVFYNWKKIKVWFSLSVLPCLSKSMTPNVVLYIYLFAWYKLNRICVMTLFTRLCKCHMTFVTILSLMTA